VPKLTGVELWSGLACASGARLAIIPDVISVSERTQLDGQDSLTVTFRRQSGAWSSVLEGRVVRLQYDDNSFDEWRIGPQTEQQRSEQNELTASLTCAPVLQDLLRGLCKRAEADGLTYYDFEYLGLTPAALLALILADSPTYFAAGTVTPTAVRDLRFAWSTPLEALRGLAEVTRSELAARRNASTNYLLDVVTAIGSGAPSVLLLTGKNLTQLARSTTTDEQATRLIPRGGGEEGEARTIARAKWRVDGKVAGVSVDLTSPVAGEDGPAQFADQFNGMYLQEKTTGTLQAITDTVVVSATLTRLSIATTGGFTVGDLVELRLNVAGDDLTYLDDPANAALYGTVPKVYDRPDIIPGTQNLVPNPELNGTYAAGIPNSGWAKVGTPTCAEETGGDYTRRGGKSCHVTCDTIGEGIETTAVIVAPTASRPYFSAHFTFRIVAGRVRVELLDVTNTRTYPEGTAGQAVSSQQGAWTDLGLEGLDLNAVTCASVKLRITGETATTEYYVDSAQLTQTAEQQAFLAGDGARQLWQAANDELAVRATPRVTVALGLLDLQRFDSAAWPYEALVLGGTVVIRDTDLGIDVTTRITGLTRDLLTPMATQVVLSNRPGELTDNVVPGRARDRLDDGVVPDPVRPIALSVRARVTATTATDVTVRVAVADPHPQGANTASIAYQDLGSGGVAPASPQTVTPETTLTEAANTYKDFTVTRPAFGADPGRVTFTATAASRVSAQDAIDVLPQGLDVGEYRAKAYVSGNLTIPDNTVTPLDFGGEYYDVGALHSTVSNKNRMTVPATGYIDGIWLIIANINWSAPGTAAGRGEIYFRDKNGSPVGQGAANAWHSVNVGCIQCIVAAIINPTAGDWYEVVGYQDTGGNVIIGAGEFTMVHLW